MLYWAVVFLILSLVSSLFGFGGIAATAAFLGKILFGAFLILFLVFLVMALFKNNQHQ